MQESMIGVTINNNKAFLPSLKLSAASDSSVAQSESYCNIISNLPPQVSYYTRIERSCPLQIKLKNIHLSGHVHIIIIYMHVLHCILRTFERSNTKWAGEQDLKIVSIMKIACKRCLAVHVTLFMSLLNRACASKGARKRVLRLPQVFRPPPKIIVKAFQNLHLQSIPFM